MSTETGIFENKAVIATLLSLGDIVNMLSAAFTSVTLSRYLDSSVSVSCSEILTVTVLIFCSLIFIYYKEATVVEDENGDLDASHICILFVIVFFAIILLCVLFFKLLS